jgi:arylformamidase
VARIWDISQPVSAGMLVWPGDPPVSIERVARIDAGDVANVSALRLGSHTGTHIDPPFHFFEDGAGVDRLPLDALAGDAVVVEIGRSRGTIDPPDLEAAGLGGAQRVLFKTGNSQLWAQPGVTFPAEYVSLSAEGARWLVDHGVRLVGIDFLSVEAQTAPGHPTHRILLGAGVVVVEGLDLSAVPAGRYRLVCLPLRIVDGDGGPARAILLED